MKNLSTCIVLFLTMTLLLLLCACGAKPDDSPPTVEQAPPKDEVEMMLREMAKVSSFHSKSNMELVMDVFGSELVVTGKSDLIYSLEGDDLYLNSYVYTMAEYEKTVMKNSTRNAFYDNTFFYSAFVGDEEVRRRSEMTPEEFLQYFSKVEEDYGFLKRYTSLEHTENEDGTHTILLSDYDTELFKLLNHSLSLPYEDNGPVIEALAVTVKTNDKWWPDEIVVEYFFSDETSHGRETITFEEYNSAERDFLYMDPMQYGKVDDATLIAQLSTMINKKLLEEKNSFDIKTFEEIIVQQSNVTSPESNKAEQEARFDYGLDEDGNFYFDMHKKTLGNIRETSSYRNGFYTAYGQEPVEMNKITAKSQILQAIDPYNFSPLMVLNVKLVEVKDGIKTYELSLVTTESPFADIEQYYYKALKIPKNSMSVILLVEVAEEEILSLSYDIRIQYKTGYYNQNLKERIETTVDIQLYYETVFLQD